jgi:hypothetical protein
LDAREEEKEKTTTSSGESMCGIPKRRVSLTFLAFFVLFKKEKKNEKFLFFFILFKNGAQLTHKRPFFET